MDVCEARSSALLSGTMDWSTQSTPEIDRARVVMEGWLRKPGSKLGGRKQWNERYFVLRGQSLAYYIRRADVKPKGAFVITPDCAVSDVYVSFLKEKAPNVRAIAASAANDADASSPAHSDRQLGDIVETELFGEAGVSITASRDGKKSKYSKNSLYCIKINWPGKSVPGPNNQGTSLDDSSVVQSPEPSAPTPTSAAGSVESAVKSRRQSFTGEVTRGSFSNVAENVAESSPRTRLTPTSSKARKLRGKTEGEFKDNNNLGLPILSSESFEGSPIHTQTPVSLDAADAVSTPISGNVRRKFTTDSSRKENLAPPLLPAFAGDADDQAPFEPQIMQRTASSRSNGIELTLVDTRQPMNSPNPNIISTPESSSTNREIVPAGGGINRHYADQVQRQALVSRRDQEELTKIMYLAAKRARDKKQKKRLVKGTKYAAAAGAAITAGVLTAGVGLATGLVFMGVAAAAGSSGAMAEASFKNRKGGTSLVLAATSYNEARAWKLAIETVINSEELTESTWADLFRKEGRKMSAVLRPTPALTREPSDGSAGMVENAASAGVRGIVQDGGTPVSSTGRNLTLPNEGLEFNFDPSSTWRPMEGGWATILGTGAQGLRIFREEKSLQVGIVPGPGAILKGISAGRIRDLFGQQSPTESKACPVFKAQVILNATPLDAFMCLMSNARMNEPIEGGEVLAPQLAPNSGQRASFRIIETLDEHMDIIHLVFRPLYLFPSWTAPRDYVLFRYWRFERDGTYMVCYDSVQHRECPPMPTHVRGEMHGVYTISPRKTVRRNGAGGPIIARSAPECLLTQFIQVDPRGWIPTISLPPVANQGYAEAFSVSALLQILDVRDALDGDRFVSVALGSHRPRWKEAMQGHLAVAANAAAQQQGGHKTTLSSGSADLPARAMEEMHITIEESLDEELLADDPVNYDFKYSSREIKYDAKNDDEDDELIETSSLAIQRSISVEPEPLPAQFWAEPDANSFRVRGKFYKRDKKKFNAGPSMFRLIAVDIVEVPALIYSGMSTHPRERVQRAIAREDLGTASDMPPFVVIVNIMVSGPPFYQLVCYYAVDDMSTIDGTDGTPSSILANQFFFGESDEFRDKTFKLIPMIVEGNFMVRKAVGSTPAIMGKKLKQTYIRSERAFELIIDTGSSSVAAGVIRLCSGYARSIVVDMAFLLEGNDESTLPERVFGCVRLKNVDFRRKLRWVDPAE